VNKTLLSSAFIVLVFAVVASAQPASQPNKVGIINIQGALGSTQEGQKALADLQTRYAPKQKELEAKRSEIAALSDQLSRGSNTMSPEAKESLTRDIDQRTKALNRATEDAQADYQQDMDKILQGLYQRLYAVIDKYSRDNGYSLILDVGSQQTPVVWWANATDISNDIVALYDKNTPAAAPAAAPPAVKPVAPSKPAVAPAKAK
jgi:outer membrane protein